MGSINRIRRAGVICIAAAMMWIVALFIEYGFGLKPPGHGPLYILNQLMFFVAMSGFVTTIIGLMWARAAGDGLFGKLALGIFTVGWSLLIVAGIVALITGNPDLPLYPIGGVLSTVGGVLAGIAVVVARRWHGWQRVTVLAYGLYYLLVLFLPIIVANQEPTLVTEVIWGLAWIPIGLALYTTQRQPHLSHQQIAFALNQSTSHDKPA